MSPRHQTAPPFHERHRPAPDARASRGRRPGARAATALTCAFVALPAFLAAAAPPAAATTPAPTSAAAMASASPMTSMTSMTPARGAARSRAPLYAVALGDSVPSGARCNCVPFVQSAASRIGRRQGRDDVTTSYASGSVTSSVLVRQLQNAQVRRVVGRSDLAVVEAGANDFDPSIAARCRDRIRSCYGRDLDRLKVNLTSSLRTVYKLQRSARSEVVVLGYWNVFRDGAVGRSLGSDFVVGSDRLTRAVNQVVRQAAADSGALYADAYTPFKSSGGRDCTRYLAADGDHPNAAGHALLADAVIRRLGAEVDRI